MKVIALLKYNSFKEIINDYNIAILADNNIRKKELLNTLEKIYTKEEQNKYGILGIKFDLI